MKHMVLVLGLLALVASACGGDSVHSDVTAARDAASVSVGADVFAAHCADCHGDSLEGGIGPALVDAELGHPDSDFVEFVTDGKGDMDGFRDELSSDEILSVVDFVRQVQNDNLE